MNYCCHRVMLWCLMICMIGLSALSAQSDEFNGPCSQEQWLRINETEGWNVDDLEQYDIGITNPGSMTIMPYTTSWFAEYRGPLVYKDIAGDFVITAKVDVGNRTDGLGSIPGSIYSLCGLMLRATTDLTTGASGWQPGQQNYIFLSIGYADESHQTCPGPCPAPHFEVKSTTNSNSVLQVSSIDTASATIRIARVGSSILVLYQLPGGDWHLHQRYHRQDFPDTLQVGMVVYTDWPKVNSLSEEFHNSHVISPALGDSDPSDVPLNPDIIGVYDFVRFTEVPNGLYSINPLAADSLTVVQMLNFPSMPDEILIGNFWIGGESEDWIAGNNWSEGVPTSSDTVRIQDCSCPNSSCPTLLTGTTTVHSLVLMPGGDLTIAEGATLIVAGTPGVKGPYFRNDGHITVLGTLIIQNVDEAVVNNSSLEIATNATLDIILQE